ncbi:MAG: response regulator [Deltaproteobacteria bacterium]|nr:response regulator [Deltaproteobacteria bacterium]
MKLVKVLIIDDEPQNVRYLTTILEENGFTDIQAAFDGVDGLAKVASFQPGLILLDLRMPKKNGIMVFNDLRGNERFKDIPIIILTGEGGFLKHLAELRQFREDGPPLDDKTAEEVLGRFIASHPDGFLEKPVEPERLLSIIRKLLVTLEEVKEARQKEVNALRERKLTGGVQFKGVLFDSREQSRNALAATAAMLAALDSKLPEGFAWRSLDNRNIAMDPKELLAFQAAMTGWVYRNYQASWAHKAAIAALSSIEEAESYDLQRGWPEKVL